MSASLTGRQWKNTGLESDKFLARVLVFLLGPPSFFSVVSAPLFVVRAASPQCPHTAKLQPTAWRETHSLIFSRKSVLRVIYAAWSRKNIWSLVSREAEKTLMWNIVSSVEQYLYMLSTLCRPNVPMQCASLSRRRHVLMPEMNALSRSQFAHPSLNSPNSSTAKRMCLSASGYVILREREKRQAQLPSLNQIIMGTERSERDTEECEKSE